MSILFLKKVKPLIIIASALILIYSCNRRISKENNIHGIRVTQTFPEMNKSGKLLSYDTSYTDIYYYQNKLLYFSSYHFDSIVQNKLIKAELRHFYFVYAKGDKYGFIYDSSKSVFWKKCLADSVINTLWCNKIEFYRSIFDKGIPNLIRKNYDAANGILNEYYTIKGKLDTTMTGTLFLRFSNSMNDVDYSLSKELDNIKKRKLFEVKIVNNARLIKEYNLQIDTIEQNFSFKKLSITNYNKILTYFKEDTYIK